MTLDELGVGQSAYIRKIKSDLPMRRRLLDLGLVPDTEVMLIKTAPGGDPVDIYIRGFELTIRKESAKGIEIERIKNDEP